jgi:hypothetical protein
MLRKLMIPFAILALVLVLAACGGRRNETTADPTPLAPPSNGQQQQNLPPGTNIVDAGGWKIGIITGTITQGEEEYLASANMQARFGDDRIVRTTYPDAFGPEVATTIANVLALADAGAEAIVFVQAVPGAIAAIQQVRDRFGQDIFFFAGVTHEPPAEIAAHADIAIISDDLGMGRVIVEQAVAMGADTFAHISFPRHLGMENIAARRALLQETAAQYGLKWVEITAPDPMAEGVPAAQMFILENAPRWIAEHGQNTAFFSTNCGMQEPLITQIIAYGGLYPLQCCPSPFHALPAALNISMEGNEGNVDFLLSQLTAAVAAQGATGRISTWPVPINMLLIEVGTLYSIEFLEGRTNGRHDPVVLERIINEVVAGFGGDAVQLSHWPREGGGFIDNFYRLLSGFVTF